MMEALRFDEPSHTYWVGAQRLPSVSEVLLPIQDFSGIPRNVLEAKANLGKVIHASAALDDVGDLDESTVYPLAQPYLDAWRKFRREFERFEFSLIEKPLVDTKLGFAGTPDRLAFDERGKGWVIDIKSTVEISPVVGVQLAAYGALAQQHFRDLFSATGVQHLNYAAVQLKPDGKYVFEEIRAASEWPTFLSLLNVRNWKAKHGISTGY